MATLSDGDHRNPVPRTPPRVLHVTQPTSAGVAVAVLDLAAAQSAAGWQVTVASPPDPTFVDRVRAVGAHHVEWVAGREPGPSLLREVRALRRTVRRVAPDLVHLHSSKAGLAGRLRRGLGSRVVFEPHAWSFEAVTGARRRIVTAWERLAARRTDLLLCVSEAERSAGIAAGVRGPFAVVANGVDLERCRFVDADERATVRRDLGVADGPLVVCVGRLCEQKGQDLLVDAWPAVRARVPDARLVLVGDGPWRDRLGAAPGVELLGHRDDALRWMQAADLVAIPSRWEGLPFVLLEAMASGRGVVASDIPPIREVLEGVGTLVPTGDAPALARAIVERLLDPTAAAQDANRARDRVVMAYDLRVQVAAVLERCEALVRG